MLCKRPVWDPLPDPNPPDPAGAQDFQALATELLPSIESGVDGLALSLLSLDAARAEGDAATAALALDLAAGQSDLYVLEAAAGADTLALELIQAAEQDAVLGSVANDIAGVLT